MPEPVRVQAGVACHERFAPLLDQRVVGHADEDRVRPASSHRGALTGEL